MNKKHIVIAAIVLIALVLYLQRGNLAMRILPKAIETAMSADPIEDLGAGLHVALCGAGGPLPDPKRSGACVAVIAGEKMFIVDAGTNGARNLGRMRYSVGAVEAVFLTHFHSDHIDGLGELATLRWVSANHKTPLPVFGPEGVSDIVDGFNTAYARDTQYRHDHHGDGVAALSGRGMTAVGFLLPKEGELLTVYQQDGLTVQMLAVDHHPVSPAVAYLFSYQGRTTLISGDTAKSTNLQEFAKDIDLLVHEALSARLVGVMNTAARNTNNTVMTKITVDIPDYHATPVEAAEIARDASVGHLLYYHIVPALILPGMEAAWLDGVKDIFSDFTLGEDGTTFTLPPDSDEIRKVRQGI
jgi:ribonuclease Z